MGSTTNINVEVFMCNNDLEIDEAADLYTVLIQELTECINELKKSVKERDIKSTQKNLHNIKGITSSYRLINVYEIASTIYTQLKAGMIKNIEDTSNKLIEEVKSEQNRILQYFSNAGIILEVEK